MWTNPYQNEKTKTSLYQCGRAKTKVIENAYVIYPFSWSNVDGQKLYENASVDANLFMRFRQNENGGFPKRGQGLSSVRMTPFFFTIATWLLRLNRVCLETGMTLLVGLTISFCFLKACANERNMLCHHVGHNTLRSFVHHVGQCCMMLAYIASSLKPVKLFAQHSQHFFCSPVIDEPGGCIPT